MSKRAAVLYGGTTLCFDKTLLKHLVLLFDDVRFLYHPSHAIRLMESMREHMDKNPLLAKALSGVPETYEYLAGEGAVSYAADLAGFKQAYQSALVSPKLSGIADGSLLQYVGANWRDTLDIQPGSLTTSALLNYEISPLMFVYYGEPEVRKHTQWLLDPGHRERRFTQAVNTMAIVLNTLLLYSLENRLGLVFDSEHVQKLVMGRLGGLGPLVARDGESALARGVSTATLELAVARRIVKPGTLESMTFKQVIRHRSSGAVALADFRAALGELLERVQRRGSWTSREPDVERLVQAEVEPELQRLDAKLRGHLRTLWGDIVIGEAFAAPAILTALVTPFNYTMLAAAVSATLLPIVTAVRTRNERDKTAGESSFLGYLVRIG